MFLNQLKLELIKKIVNAKLSKTEINAITAKAEEIISNRKEKKDK